MTPTNDESNLNVLNFNKMKDELQRLFDMDQSSNNYLNISEERGAKEPLSPQALMQNARLNNEE